MQPFGTKQNWLVAGALGLSFALAGAAVAQTAVPASTTETFGHWTLACKDGPPAKGTAAVQTCEILERLSVKGKDGYPHPLLEMALGKPPSAGAMHLALRVPLGVALRDGIQLSLDKPGRPSKAQEVLLKLDYITCTQAGCAAEAAKIGDTLARLKKLTKVYVTFTILAKAQKITVPVSLDGFTDALAALEAHGT